MNLLPWTICLFTTLLHLPIFGLEHEKSFLLKETAASAFYIALYQNSLLLTSANDIVQKDIATGAVQRNFRAHSSIVTSILLTNDDRMITVSLDSTLIVWNVKTGSVIRRIKLETSSNAIISVSYQNDFVFAGGTDQKLRKIDLSGASTARTIALGVEVQKVIVNRNFLYVGKASRTRQLEKYRTSNMLLDMNFEGHTGAINALEFYKNSLYSASTDRNIFSWNGDTGEIITRYLDYFGVAYFMLVANDILFVAGTDKDIYSWRTENGSKWKIFLPSHGDIIISLAVNSDTLFSGSSDTVIKRTPLTGHFPDFTYRSRLKRTLNSVLWKNRMISSGEESTIRLLDVSSNNYLPYAVLTDHVLEISSLHLHENLLFSGSSDQTIRQWNLTQLICTMIFRSNLDTIHALLFTDGVLYSGGYDGILLSWNISTGVIAARFGVHQSTIVEIKHNNDFIFSGSEDGIVQFWSKDYLQFVRSVDAIDLIFSMATFENFLVIGTSRGIAMYDVFTGATVVNRGESAGCNCVAIRGTRLFSGHVNHQIRSRDSATLEILETYSGHEDGVHSIAFDENFILFSCSYDGVIKKWNMASRTVAFSFEDRNSSITTLALHKSLLLVGTMVGDIRCFNLNDTTLFGTIDLHRGAVSSIAIKDDIVFSSGMDGKLLRFAGNEIMNVRVLFDSASPLQSLTLASNSLITLTRGTEVVIWPQDGNFTSQNTIYASEPLTTLTVTKAFIISGSKSGTIFAWDLRTYTLAFVLNKHTFQVNHLIAYNDMLFSASEDMTIMQWSLPGRQFVRAFQRTSNFNLGHMGPVNSLAICGGVLFSGGSDLVTRRWNIETGKHQDLLVGHFKPVTSVLCYNDSVLTGSEDSAVFLFRPDLKDVKIVSLGTLTKSNVRQRQRKTVIRSSFLSTESLMQNRQAIIYITVSVAILISCCVTLFLFSRKKRSGDKSSPAVFAYKTDSSQTVTDLETIINSVMGISKHAAYLIDSSCIAKIKKLAAGGGGEIYLAKTMDAALRAKLGDIVVQKIIFARSKPFEEAFYQEVGIMIMLSTFPNFCKILGYTENPLSMILAYYPDGSLNEWLLKNHLSLRTTVKILREISSALNTMHSHFLAHCDIKSQNVLVQIERGIPSCYLTDFGITQVLSEKIIATKSFHVINLRGLSVHYASPEAFGNFRSKKFGRADFKKYDIYSLSCIMFEVLTKRSPWN